MSYLAFHGHAAVRHLPGRQVRAILGLAQFALDARLSRGRHSRVRGELGLPSVDSQFFESQLLWLMMDGEAHRVSGHDVYLMNLALQAMYEQYPKYGILCWLFDNASRHGWIADADRAVAAAEIDAVLDGGPPVLDRAAWGAVMAFLRDGTGDIVTSLAPAEGFPGWRLAWEAQAWRPAVRNTAEPRDELEGLWEGLSDDARWELGMTALNGDPARQWHPGQYRFSDLTLSSAPGCPGGLVPVGQITTRIQ